MALDSVRWCGREFCHSAELGTRQAGTLWRGPALELDTAWMWARVLLRDAGLGTHVGLADYGAALALWTPAAREEQSLGASLAQDWYLYSGILSQRQGGWLTKFLYLEHRWRRQKGSSTTPTLWGRWLHLRSMALDSVRWCGREFCHSAGLGTRQAGTLWRGPALELDTAWMWARVLLGDAGLGTHVGLADYGAALALWTPAAREEQSLGASLAQDWYLYSGILSQRFLYLEHRWRRQKGSSTTPTLWGRWLHLRSMALDSVRWCGREFCHSAGLGTRQAGTLWRGPALELDTAWMWARVLLGDAGLGTHVGLADGGAALALWTPAAREEQSLGASLAQVFSTLIAAISNALQQLRELNEERTEQFAKVRRYFSSNSVQSGLAKKAWAALSLAAQKPKRRTDWDEIKILQHLPKSLQAELHRHIREPVLSVHPFFFAFDRAFTVQMQQVYQLCISEISAEQG
ncbi:unnamed protein product [Polarella glacialis]|uniref:Uncharacterized protein n=1 Tax=Polarella glacialis TaxID=89957 RepID=A0A813GXT0_POLGL|nr:unnamed protein product [Polarella glacialis]